MENQLQPHLESSVEATYELSNLMLSQIARMTQLGIEHTKLMLALTHAQISGGLSAKTPEEAMSRFNQSVDAHVKNITEFGTDMCQLGLSFQSEDALYVESHVSQADSTLQQLMARVAPVR
jgi:hypothetical protein